MFRFEQPYLFFLMALLPVLAVIMWLVYRRLIQRTGQIGDERLIQMVIPGLSIGRWKWKQIATLVSVFLLVISLVNPQLGTKKETVEKKSTDVLIAVDISRSMLAEDVPPSRLDVAKRFTDQLIHTLRNERIGLILFAGNAYLQMPLTNDYVAAQVFVRSINVDAAGTQGTAIKDAIDLAIEASEVKDKNHSVLILISDGEDHEEEVMDAVKDAVDHDIIIHSIGVGTDAGGLIPVRYDNRPDYLRDESGEPVRTKVNTDMLKEIAREGGGDYFNITDRQVVDKIKERIDKMDKIVLEQRSFSEYQSYYSVFLLIATLLMAAVFLYPDKKQVS